MTRNPIWTAELRAACGAIVTNHRGPDVVSRAREIWHGARVGQTLTPLNVEFITAMRSRFGDQRDATSPGVERAFDAAWGAAWDTQAPTLLNGYPVLASFATPADRGTRPGHVILVHRGAPSWHPYVTAWVGEGDTQWCWGHYIADRAEAEADFRSRCARGY